MLRLLLDPIKGNVQGSKTLAIAGTHMRLTVSGDGAARVSQTQPAQIDFYAVGVKNVRTNELSEPIKVGTLEGTLGVGSSADKVLFNCDASSLDALSKPPDVANEEDTDSKVRRQWLLNLDLSTEHFALPSTQERPRGPLALQLPTEIKSFAHIELLAELKLNGAVEAKRELNDRFDLPMNAAADLPLPGQKTSVLTQVGPPPGPILLASNDDTFLPGEPSIRDQLREQHNKRGDDDSPATAPGGDFIPFRVVRSAQAPQFHFDHGFLDDGNGGIDESKRESPTAADFVALAKWRAKLNAAELLRPDLADATFRYRWFLSNLGGRVWFSYEQFARDDRNGQFVVQSAIEDVRAAAMELFDARGGAFVIQSGTIPVGATDENGQPLNARYNYPGTENWQKAIGAHVIWLEAKVSGDVEPRTGRQRIKVEMTLHALDRYNFNPGAQDIATGIADAENGRFEVTGLGKEFDSYSTLFRTIEFTMPSGAINFRSKPPDQKVSAPRRF